MPRRVKLPVVGSRGASGIPAPGHGPAPATVAAPAAPASAAPETAPPGDARAGAGPGPDPARLDQGWEHRFVTTGERVEEMVTLYRELGFEVVADPVGGGELDDGCRTCFSGQLRYHAIYTRRRSEPEDPDTSGD